MCDYRQCFEHSHNCSLSSRLSLFFPAWSVFNINSFWHTLQFSVQIALLHFSLNACMSLCSSPFWFARTVCLGCVFVRHAMFGVIFIQWLSLHHSSPDQENGLFMSQCTEVFFDKWPLWQHWNSDSKGCTWKCMTPCWETLEGSSWPQQTFGICQSRISVFM